MLELVQEIELTDAPILKAWSKDLKASARLLTPSEARFLVDYYYTVQEHRIATAAQVRTAGEGAEPNAVINVLFDAAETVEGRIKSALNYYTDAQSVGVWLKSLVGIGPVIAAGYLAHINLEKTSDVGVERINSVGHLWNFAGLNPDVSWDKGQKRPWNARLKTLAWKTGESFVKCCNREGCLYGRLYAERKCKETERNERGDYADQAAKILTEKRIGKETDAHASYAQGKLPPAHIHARAKRWAVKIFLSHLFEVMYWTQFKELAPKPFPIARLGHTDYIEVPSLEFVPGLREAKRRATPPD